MRTSLEGSTILVTGAAGMLARDLVPKLRLAGATVLASDLREGEVEGISIRPGDISDDRFVSALLHDARPDWVLNCAAYTKVDDAETQQEVAFQVNAIGPANLACAARDSGARVLHISSDYVFGGDCELSNRRTPISEEQAMYPCGVYGHSKRFGDELVSRILPKDSLIIRTSWLHGVHGPNFIDSILRFAKQREEIRVVNDQTGSPTWTSWLAETIVALLVKDARGVFNATSRGDITWFDFATEIVRLAGLQTRVLPQTTEELNRPAPRPVYSTLALSKLEAFLGKPCIDWKEGVAAHMALL